MRSREREKRQAESLDEALERVAAEVAAAAESRYPVKTFNVSDLDADRRSYYGFPADSTLRRREAPGSGSR